MDMILQEIERALNAGFYYLAVVMALTLPDICAALASPNGDTDPRKYKNWYTKNLAGRFQMVTADDIWSLRNGVLHQGRCGHPNMQFARIIFTLPEGQGNRLLGGAILNDALSLDAVEFCHAVIQSVQTWFAANQNDPNVKGEPYKPSSISSARLTALHRGDACYRLNGFPRALLTGTIF